MNNELIRFLKVNDNDRKDDILIISHDDLDGIVSAGIIKRAYRILEKDPEMIFHADPTSKKTWELMQEFISKNENKSVTIIISDRDFITDITPESIPDNIKFIWIDHHESSINKFLEIGNWCNIPKIYQKLDFRRERCGATLSLEFTLELLEANNSNSKTIFWNYFEELAHYTNMWDTFLWKDYPEDNANHIIGKSIGHFEKMVDRDFILNKLVDGYISKTHSALDVLLPTIRLKSAEYGETINTLLEKIVANPYIVDTLNDKRFILISGIEFKWWAGISGRLQTELNNKFEKLGIKLIDAMIFIGEEIASCYTNDDRVIVDDEFNAIKVVSYFKSVFKFTGGGHKKAAGFRHSEEGKPLNTKIITKLIRDYLEMVILK